MITSRVRALIILFALVYGHAATRAHEASIPLIFDTDMGLDDVRALVLLLYMPEVDVVAVVTSDGAASPQAGYENAMRVLAFLGRRRIPVGVGASSTSAPPSWREMSDSLGWSREKLKVRGPRHTRAAKPPSAVSLLIKTIKKRPGPLAYVCTGPLTNLAAALAVDPGIRPRISVVYFYGTPPESAPGVNRKRDEKAFQSVIQAGWRFFALALPDPGRMALDNLFLESIKRIDSPGARLVALSHSDPRVQTLIAKKHLKMWDETIPLFLSDPGLARLVKSSRGHNVYKLAHWDSDLARKHYLRILSAMDIDIPRRRPVTFQRFPAAPQLFRSDVRKLMDAILLAHGEEEWKATVLTNELHRHLGTFSIIGAKMGTRAREIFHASLDDLKVESHAGTKPPLSCMNDGLQASTGATLGRGTITIRTRPPFFPEAVFSLRERRLLLRLKQPVLDMVKENISTAAKRYGRLTPPYFEAVRRLSLVFWRDMKRSEIFEEKWLAEEE